MITETLPSERFPSLSALQAEHSALQTALGKQAVEGPQAHTIAQLVERAVETGAILDNREDRQAAQAIINYWMSRAAPSVRLESSTPNPFADPEFDSLLRDFDPRTIVGATAAADRWLESLTDEQRLTARRILLRLVRLPSDRPSFEAIPTSRTSLHDVHVDSALVDQMISGLAQSGVVRVTPGSSTEVDQVALRSADLVTSWATYSRWLKERLDFRRRAESWSQAQRLGHTSPELERGLLQGNDLEEVRSYHDRNPQERKYIETCWLRERFKSESNRRWKWIFGVLSILAIVVAWNVATQRNAALKAINDKDYFQISNKLAFETRSKCDQVYTRALIHLLVEPNLEYSHHHAKKLLIIQTLAQLVSTDEKSWEFAKLNWVVFREHLEADPAVNYWFKRQFFAHVIDGRTIDERIKLMTESWSSSRRHRQELPVIGKYLAQFIKDDLIRATTQMFQAERADGQTYTFSGGVQRRWYDLAQLTAEQLTAAAKLQKTPKDVPGFRDLFWRLYLGEMVLVESPEVEQSMIAFGRSLTKWEQSAGVASDELLAEFERNVAGLKKAIEPDITPTILPVPPDAEPKM